MGSWERWLKHPQGVWLRKAIFQVHLWSGIGLALYVVLICLSGSAIVFEDELYTAFWPGPKYVAITGTRLTREELKQAAQRLYPNYTVTGVFLGSNPSVAAEIRLQQKDKRNQRLFDPYSGKDLGPARPRSILFIGWLAQLHMNLLSGYPGRMVNGALAFLVTLLCLTGAVVWWPGIQSWRKSLTVHRAASFKRLNWDLHSAVGFWTLAFVFMWAITGAYLVFPKPFDRTINFFASAKVFRAEGVSSASLDRGSVGATVPQSVKNDGVMRQRTYSVFDPGDSIRRLHLGNFGGWPVKALWVVLGLAPVCLAVTGVLMWWNRVLSPRIALRQVQPRTDAEGKVFSDSSRRPTKYPQDAPIGGARST